MRELEADLLRDLLVHVRACDSHRVLPEQTIEGRGDLLHLLSSVPNDWVPQVAVCAHVLRQRVSLLLEQ